MQRLLKNKNPSCGCGGPTVPLISESQRPTSGRKKKAIFQSDSSPIHATVTLLYQTQELTPRYDTVISRTCVAAKASNIVFQIVAKQLQIDTWLVFTAHKKWPSFCLTVPSPTFFDVPFSHNTCVTNKQTTDRRHIIPKARPNGWPKTGAIKLCKCLQKVRNTDLRSYFNANECVFFYFYFF